MRVAFVVFVGLFAASGCGSSSSSDGADVAPQQDSSTSDSGVDGRVGSDSGSDAANDASSEAPVDAPLDAPSDGPTSCITDLSPGSHRFTCDGFVYDVEVPAACTASGCGLVLDVHGATMSGKMEDDNTGMRALGRKYGYVVVQPNANPKPPLSSWTASTDDAKVHAFLVAAIAAFKIDTKRVHMTGFSQGGMMTFRFLCKHADLFASVAPAAGEGCSFTAGDTPSRQIPVLFMHGTADAIVGYDANAVPQRDALVAGWSMGTGTVIASDAHYTRTRWTSASGNVFELIQHDYQASSAILKGHCYPGSTDPGGEPGQLFPFGCVPPNAFVWGEEVMAFFLAHPGS